MQKIPLSLAKPGMVLAKPIVNEMGIALCGEGTELTGALIDRLVRMNISSLYLAGEPVGQAEPKKEDAQCVKELNERFAQVRRDPLMEKLRSAIEHALVSPDNEKGVAA